MSSTSTISAPVATDALLASVGVDRDTYGDTARLANLLSGATGAVVAADLLALGRYPTGKALAEGLDVSEATVSRLVNAGRVMLRLGDDAVGIERGIYSAVTVLGITKVTAMLDESIGIDLIMGEARKVKQGQNAGRGGANPDGGSTDTPDAPKAPTTTLGLLQSIEAVTAGLLAKAPKRMNAAERAALVSIIDTLSAVAEGAGVDIEKVRAEIAA